MYLKKATEQMPIFHQINSLEVPLGKGYLTPKGAWNLFENQDDAYISSHNVLPTKEVVIDTEKGQESLNTKYKTELYKLQIICFLATMSSLYECYNFVLETLYKSYMHN